MPDNDSDVTDIWELSFIDDNNNPDYESIDERNFDSTFTGEMTRQIISKWRGKWDGTRWRWRRRRKRNREVGITISDKMATIQGRISCSLVDPRCDKLNSPLQSEVINLQRKSTCHEFEYGNHPMSDLRKRLEIEKENHNNPRKHFRKWFRGIPGSKALWYFETRLKPIKNNLLKARFLATTESCGN